MTNQGWIGVDLDGTLAVYDGNCDPDRVGPPVPAMLARVAGWLRAGVTVKIVTARVADPGRRVRAQAAIQRWCLEHLGRALEVTASKDFGMVELWDDRAVQVIPNTGRRADGRD